MLYNPIYNPNDIIQDLKNNNVDINEFYERLKKLNNGTVFNQFMFEYLYTVYVINNYKI
jgi:hypothetical protein